MLVQKRGNEHCGTYINSLISQKTGDALDNFTLDLSKCSRQFLVGQGYLVVNDAEGTVYASRTAKLEGSRVSGGTTIEFALFLVCGQSDLTLLTKFLSHLLFEVIHHALNDILISPLGTFELFLQYLF